MDKVQSENGRNKTPKKAENKLFKVLKPIDTIGLLFAMQKENISFFNYAIYQFMKGTQLGEFEEIVLLTVALLYDDAYGVAVLEELTSRLERPMSLGVVHRTLQRLEEKGLIQSRFSEPVAERGGRSKRLFTMTLAGEQALQQARRIRNELWNGIPKTAFDHLT
ncbi:hypothetical protein GCM10028819_08330 [Spirosoma humi]